MKTKIMDESRSCEIIRKHYLEKDFKLSPKMEAIRRRWVAAHTLILESGFKDSGVVNVLMKMYNITERQAYRDIRNSRELFGYFQDGTAPYYRHLVTQWAVEMYRKAEIRQDLHCGLAALGRMITVNHLDKDEPDYPDPSKIQPPDQVLFIDYHFLQTHYFKMIDDTAQRKLLALNKKFWKLAKEFGVKEYLDELLTEPLFSEDLSDER